MENTPTCCPILKKCRTSWEKLFNDTVPVIDRKALEMPEKDARAFLTRFSVEQAEKSTGAWKKLGEYLLVKYMDGNIKKEKDGKFLQNDKHIPPGIIRAGYPQEYYRMMVKENPGLRMKTAEELKNRK